MGEIDLLFKSLESGSSVMMLFAMFYLFRQKSGATAAVSNNHEAIADKMIELSRQQEKTAAAVEKAATAASYEHQAIRDMQQNIIRAVERVGE